jgi:nucleotide-binding universal stress UspA family protein
MRKIVVGVDLSPHAELAAAHAVELARLDRAELALVLCDLIPETPVGLAPSVVAAANAYSHRLVARLDEDRRRLDELAAKLADRGVRINAQVVDGYPDEQLPRIAQELGAELIVVGSHGRTGIKRFLIGSVAERVVRIADTSVLVARTPAPTDGYRRIVVGIDFDPMSDRALARAVELAPAGGRVDAVHCWQLSPLAYPAEAPTLMPAYEQVRRDTITELERTGRTLAEQAQATRPGVEVRFHLLERPAAHGLDDFARDVHADLVVVGSHGRRGLRRFLVGSVAEVTVRHAPCSVLVVRPLPT